jgi:hypothetical protein
LVQVSPSANAGGVASSQRGTATEGEGVLDGLGEGVLVGVESPAPPSDVHAKSTTPAAIRIQRFKTAVLL